MLVNRKREDSKHMEKRRLRISSKRQITIPSKYFEALGLSDEVECIYANNMLILTPIKNENPAFAEEILSDLINQGYTGQKLLTEFKRINCQVHPAVEKIIEQADALAKESSVNYIDRTDEIFGMDIETED